MPDFKLGYNFSGLVFACLFAYDYAVGTSVGSDDSVKWWGRFGGISLGLYR
jgi:hypothetical protein